MNTRPSEGNVRVASMPTAVDLPMPFGPNSTHRSPAWMMRFTSVMMTRRLRRNSTLSSLRTSLSAVSVVGMLWFLVVGRFAGSAGLEWLR